MTTTVTIRHPKQAGQSLSIVRVENLPDGTNQPIGRIVELRPGREIDMRLTASMYLVVAETPHPNTIQVSPTEGETP